MDKIAYTGIFGLEEKVIELSRPMGAGEVVHLYVAKYYQGQFIKRPDGWHVALTNKAELTGDDVWLIIDLIENGVSHDASR